LTEKIDKLREDAHSAHLVAIDNPCKENVEILRVAEEALQAELAKYSQPTTVYVPPELGIKPRPFPPSTPKPEEKQQQKQKTSIVCKHCGEEFDHFWQIGVHMRKVRIKERKDLYKRNQLSPIPTDMPKNYKIIKVEHLRSSTRISSTTFIPPSWDFVKVHKPVDTKHGRWVFFEPLVLEITKPIAPN